MGNLSPDCKGIAVLCTVSRHTDKMQKVANTRMSSSHTASPFPLSKTQHSNNSIVTIIIVLPFSLAFLVTVLLL